MKFRDLFKSQHVRISDAGMKYLKSLKHISMNADNPSQQPDCERHKKEVAGISDMKQLAEMIGDLHYSTLGELLHYLEQKLYSDSVKDGAAGRIQLSESLRGAWWHTGQLRHWIQQAWKISKPFMTDKNTNQ